MRSGTATLAVGNPSSRPAPVAPLHPAADLVGTPQDHGRARDVATRELVARPRRRVRQAAVGRVGRLRRRDQPETQDLEAELGAHPLEQRDVAVTLVPEVEIGADDDQPRAEHTGQHLADEVFGRLLAARLVEREHEAFVDRSRRVEELQLLVEGRQEFRRRRGAHDLGGMTVEREHRGAQLPRVREVVHEPQHRLVAEVHAVERADRDRAADRVVTHGRTDGSGIAPDDHDDDSWGASTTDGFTPPPRRS